MWKLNRSISIIMLAFILQTQLIFALITLCVNKKYQPVFQSREHVAEKILQTLFGSFLKYFHFVFPYLMQEFYLIHRKARQVLDWETSFEETTKMEVRSESFDAHLFDLPDDLLFEVMKKLDIDSLEALGQTCKFLKQKYKEFESIFPESMARARMLKFAAIRNGYNLPTDSDDGDWLDDEDDLSEPYDYTDDLLNNRFDDMLDNVSYGSNYDEEFDDYYNRPLWVFKSDLWRITSAGKTL